MSTICRTVTEDGGIAVTEIAKRFDANALLFRNLILSEHVQGQTKGVEAIQRLLQML
jgi:hypothetical protein